MKTIAILMLATSVAAALGPFAFAASCATSPPREELAETQPLMPAGMYLHVTTSGVARSGVWTETNGQPGLQTSGCGNFYRADDNLLL